MSKADQACGRTDAGASASYPFALQRAMEILSQATPLPAARAKTAQAVLLHSIRNSAWPEVAWEFSYLTGDGFPLELNFSSADKALRYTTEIAGPEVAEADRMQRAEKLIAHLSGAGLPRHVMQRLRYVQSRGRLAYGAWVGGRHDPHGDRYKLYVEVPCADAPVDNYLLEAYLGRESLLYSQTPQCRMIGFDPGARRMEVYFRVDRLEEWELGRLLRRAGLSSRRGELVGLLEQAFDRSMSVGVPTLRIGFSYSFVSGGGPIVFSLFLYARSVFGSDASIRRKLLALASQRGWDLSLYAAMSAPLAATKTRGAAHGLLAFVVSERGPLVLQVGLRPPDDPQVAV